MGGGGYGRRFFALAALAFLAFLLFFILMVMPKGGSPLLWGARQPLVAASIEVEGRGSVSANGTLLRSWNSTKPFALVLEAVPEKCWAFKGWLVNGTPYSAEPNAMLTVRGNTTVKAVFERPVYAVSIVPILYPAQAANVSAKVNGTLLKLPVNVSAPACSLLEIEPVAPEGYVPFNGTVRVAVLRDAVVKLYFEEARYKLRFENIVVPVNVTFPGGWNVTVRNDTELLLARGRYSVTPSPLCLPLNATHDLCVFGWILRSGGGVMVASTAGFVLDVTTDYVAVQVVEASPRNVTRTVVIATPQGPFTGVIVQDPRIRVFGSVTTSGSRIRISGHGIFYVKMPSGWRKARVSVLLWNPWKGYYSSLTIHVVMRNEPSEGAMAIGNFVKSGKALIEIDRECLASWVSRYCRKDEEGYWTCLGGDEVEFAQCFKAVEGRVSALYTAAFSIKPIEGVEAGWLRIDVIDGDAEMEIEVLG